MIDILVSKARTGFNTLRVNESHKEQALTNLELWLSDEHYSDYVAQIKYLIDSEHWDYLLDSFYQDIPFGTGGRRGEVGIGPNRINPVTIRNSAQGHSQYLIARYGNEAKRRGVVLAYDVREFLGVSMLSRDLPNPVQNLTSKKLAISAAEVYTGNGIKTFLFDDVRTTPELSFAIRHLGTVGGDVFSASHNPPTHNGKKVYDEFGGQLIPPHDEALVHEVTQNVSVIKDLDFQSAQHRGLISFIGEEVDRAYIQAAAKISLSDERNVTIAYTPLHGTGSTSIVRVLESLGFNVLIDPATAIPSGAFENVTFQIPNPEVIQSFDTSLVFAKEQGADILISSDPDADRIGLMISHRGEWKFLNGNEIATILTKYAASRLKTPGTGIVVKTVVTTGAIKGICDQYGLRLIDDLLIGFKYVGDVMNTLEAEGESDNFLLGAEESHGYLAGNYARDKDAVTGALWLSELAAELKNEGRTLIDYLNAIYLENGYYKNYLTEIRMIGASGNEKIHRIQKIFRSDMPTSFGRYKVMRSIDYRDHQPIVSETDYAAKDMLVFWLEDHDDIDAIKVTIRPSGTEPKIKIYIELGFTPSASMEHLAATIKGSSAIVSDIEKAVMLKMYETIDISFPERGFLLFWQLPLDDKLKYFEVEPKIAALKDIDGIEQRKQQLHSLLAFLGANPLQKVNDAFSAHFGAPIEDYLELE